MEWVDHGNLRGVGIQKIEQISSSTDSLGANVIRVTLDDGSFYDYTVRNGDRGPAGSLWIGTSEPPDDSYSIWLNPSGMVSGYVGANQGAENSGRVLAVGEDGVVIPREETQPDYTQNDSTKPDYIKNRPGGYLGEQKTYKLDISAVKQDGIDELTDVSVLQDDFMHMSSINVEISHSSGTINRTLTQREIGPYIINMYGVSVYGNAHLISPSQPDTGEDMALYKEMDSESNYSIGWHVWATSVPSGDVEVCVVEKTMNAVRFDPEFIPWYASPTKDAVLYTAQSLTEAQQAQARANIGAGTPYTLPQASQDALGGIKADAAETADTQPVRIGGDGKLYTAPGGGGADISLGISGATAGQMAKIKTVNESGAPTAWEAGDAASGESEWRLIRDVQIEEDVTSVYISDDDAGNPFSLKKIACVIYSDGGTGMTSTAYMKCAFNTTSMTENRFLDIKDIFKPYGSHCAFIFVTNFDGPFVYTECIKYENNGKPFDNAGNTVFNYQSSSVGGLVNVVAPAERLTSLLIYNDSSATLRAGSRIQLYGVKA